LAHIVATPFVDETESVNSVKAAADAGYNASASQTLRVIGLTVLAVITVVAHGFTTVSIKLDGVTRASEVPYVMPLTFTLVI